MRINASFFWFSGLRISVNGLPLPQLATLGRREGIAENHSRPTENKAIDRGTARSSQLGGLTSSYAKATEDKSAE